MEEDAEKFYMKLKECVRKEVSGRRMLKLMKVAIK
jgi:hypothetical protein